MFIFGETKTVKVKIMEYTITLPTIGKFYSPFKNGNAMVLEMIYEDVEYYKFNDGTKYPKDLDFSWFERKRIVEPQEKKCNVIGYNLYSNWSKQIAKSYTVEEIDKVINETEGLTNKYALQHLSAIQATTSMSSQSQRRAHSKNNVTGNYEKKQAYKNALMIHKNFPEHAKS